MTIIATFYTELLWNVAFYLTDWPDVIILHMRSSVVAVRTVCAWHQLTPEFPKTGKATSVSVQPARLNNCS